MRVGIQDVKVGDKILRHLLFKYEVTVAKIHNDGTRYTMEYTDGDSYTHFHNYQIERLDDES